MANYVKKSPEQKALDYASKIVKELEAVIAQKKAEKGKRVTGELTDAQIIAAIKKIPDAKRLQIIQEALTTANKYALNPDKKPKGRKKEKTSTKELPAEATEEHKKK